MTKEFQVTVFSVPKMDCPSEERMIRMALEDTPAVQKLSFDLGLRQLSVIHSGSPDTLLSKLLPLNLGAQVSETREVSELEASTEPADLSESAGESRVLKQLLAINAVMFVLEISFGLISQSTGLIADSLDMFADAAVYGLGFYAVGKAKTHKQRAARLSGFVQVALALGVFFEVIRRFAVGSGPEGTLMMGVAFAALIANVSCMLLLAKHRTGGVHMQASWIFSTNDVIANVGVILAGLLVVLTGSPLPDLIVGTIIGTVVLSGALRILRVARTG